MQLYGKVRSPLPLIVVFFESPPSSTPTPTPILETQQLTSERTTQRASCTLRSASSSTSLLEPRMSTVIVMPVFGTPVTFTTCHAHKRQKARNKREDNKAFREQERCQPRFKSNIAFCSCRQRTAWYSRITGLFNVAV